MPDRTNARGTFLFVIPWDLHHAGGVNQVVINLYRECERSGLLQPLVLVLDWSHISGEEKWEVGCRTIHLRIRAPPYGERLSVRSFLAYLTQFPRALYLLRKIIKQYDVRVIDAQYPTLESLNFAILKSLALFKGKLFLSFHGLDIRNAAKRQGFEKFLWRWMTRRADALIACSNSLASDVRAYDAVAAGRLVTVRNGIDIPAIMAEKRSSTLIEHLPTRKYILTVATFEHKKGQDILVKAFARLANDFPHVDLILIGRDGPTRKQTESLLNEVGLSNRTSCILNMPHPQVLSYLKLASVFVLPSRSEGLPLAILEAAAFNLPVIASAVDGIPEVINSEEVGILFETEDDHGLENALRRLLSDDALRATLGKNLHSRVAKEFSWHKAWAEYTALLGGMPLRNRQSAYNLQHEHPEGDVDRSIHRAMRLYCVNDLGLSEEIARNRANQELQRKIPQTVLAELSRAGIEIAGSDVLDLGAGLGGMSEQLVLSGARVIALEPGIAWANITRRRVERHGREFHLVGGFGESIPLPTTSVDIVISLQVLEHVTSPSKVLAEVWRVLRPGGCFYLACENYLTFYEPHYRLFWLPLLPKFLGAAYLRILGRSPRFLNESITYVTYPGVLRRCRRLGFIRHRDSDLMSKLRSSKGLKWTLLRLLFHLTGGRGPLLLEEARFAFKNGIYELFHKPKNLPLSGLERSRQGFDVGALSESRADRSRSII